MLFRSVVHFGTARLFAEYMIYFLPTDADDKWVEIKKSSTPYQNCGQLNVVWTPMADENDTEQTGEPPLIEAPEELLGKPWTYKLEISKAAGLALCIDQAYVEYEFFGEKFTTLTIEGQTHGPEFAYTHVHHVPKVTQEFLDWLSTPGGIKLHLYVSPFVTSTGAPISTANAKIATALGFETDKTKNDPVVLKEENARLRAENEALKKELAELKKSGVASKLAGAQLTDAAVNS